MYVEILDSKNDGDTFGGGVASSCHDGDTRWEAGMVNNNGQGEAVECGDASGEQHGIEINDTVVPSMTECSVE